MNSYCKKTHEVGGSVLLSVEVTVKGAFSEVTLLVKSVFGYTDARICLAT